jgi:hypothetical protein
LQTAYFGDECVDHVSVCFPVAASSQGLIGSPHDTNAGREENSAADRAGIQNKSGEG